MKLLIIFPLLVAMVESEYECSIGYNTNDTLFCTGLELKADEPVKLNITFPKLSLKGATGSIGVKTFSQISPVKELLIDDSGISSIEDGALCSMPGLEALSIVKANKRFRIFSKTLFTNCDRLKFLFILYNGTLERTTFQSLPGLESLSLVGLSLGNYTTEYLQPLKQLKSLEFVKCTFDEINDGTLCSSPQLKNLYMFRNDISLNFTEAMFENCNTVEEFHYVLPVKQSTIEEGAFSAFVNLKIAFIDNLDIDHLSKGHLRGLKNIEELRLRHSNIRTLDNDVFEGLLKLRNLSLASNHITQLNSDVFTPLTSLAILDLSFNEISQLDSGVFVPLTALKTLMLGGNKITSIDNIKQSSIEDLDVISNLISAVDAAAVKFNMPKLKHLSVLGNNMSEGYLEALDERLGEVHLYWTELILFFH